MRWPWQAKPIPDEIDYAKCASCGGTGVAYAIDADENGPLPNGRMYYVPCPACHRGAEKLGDTEVAGS